MTGAFHGKQQPLFGQGEAADRPRIGPYESKCLEDSEVSISLRVDLNTLPDIKLRSPSLGVPWRDDEGQNDGADNRHQTRFRRISSRSRKLDVGGHMGDFADHTHRLSS
jgi:hypothetical protein